MSNETPTEKGSIENFTEFDWKDEKLQKMLYRGETPDDIQKKCHLLCAEYLRGAWTRIKPEEMVLRRISGGMTNQMYYCGLPDGVETEAEEPREVAFRMYGKKHFNYYECEEKDERMTDMIIAVLMSEKKIGAKVYGLTPVGEILEYIEARPFFEPEENDPLMVKELAQKLAQIHYLDVPIKRKNRFIESIETAHESWKIKFPKEMFESRGLKYFTKIDFGNEIEFIKRCIKVMKTPTVFNHNDFRNTNILVKNNPTDDNDKLRICDYEYGCYGYRGQDFGFLFQVWGQSKMTLEAKYPDDEVLKQFFKYYNEECTKIVTGYDKDHRNSIDYLIKEAKVWRLAMSVMGTMIFMQFENDGFEHMDKFFSDDSMFKFMDIGIKVYLILKKRFIDEKAIPEEAVTDQDSSN